MIGSALGGAPGAAGRQAMLAGPTAPMRTAIASRTAPTPYLPGQAPKNDSIPIASAYQGQEVAAQQAWANAKTIAASQLNQSELGAGLRPMSISNLAAGKNVRLDGLNPYGDFQQMHMQHDALLEAQQNTSALGGITGPGLGAQRAEAVQYANQLKNGQYGQLLEGNTQSILGKYLDAGATAGKTNVKAELNALQYATAHNMFTPVNPRAITLASKTKKGGR